MACPVVILSVAYHSHASLLQLSRDLARQRLLPARWLVVDNAPHSAPLSIADLRSPAGEGGSGQVESGFQREFACSLIEGREADGFGSGCNRGFQWLEQQAWEGWVWLLNPDTRLPTGEELASLAGALEDLPANALVGTAVRAPTGELEPSAGWIDPGLRFRRRRVGPAHRSAGRPVPLDWLSGCSLCLRPSIHEPPARFDPAFPLYYEDMDLCLRLGRQGAEVLWLPRPEVHHQRGEGSSTPSHRRLRLSTVSYMRFMARHCPLWVRWLRGTRLLLKSLLLLPLRPHGSLAALSGLREGLQAPPP